MVNGIDNILIEKIFDFEHVSVIHKPEIDMSSNPSLVYLKMIDYFSYLFCDQKPQDKKLINSLKLLGCGF